MADATADWRSALATMSDAFAAGDNQRGEDLLVFALDVGAPWDVATSTVARALSARRVRTTAPLTTEPVDDPLPA